MAEFSNDGKKLRLVEGFEYYLKQDHSKKLTHLHEKIANIRLDFLHKLTSSLIRHSNSFCLESLKVK
ncbi:transposase, partial [Helicobacter pylori]|nr:transposase [Helicobacter pylori]